MQKAAFLPQLANEIGRGPGEEIGSCKRPGVLDTWRGDEPRRSKLGFGKGKRRERG